MGIIKMASPVNVSPLIKTARWAFLGMGMLYGYKHKDTVAQWRKEERAVEKQMKEKYLLDKEEAKVAANIEFAKTSLLYGFSEENPGVIVDGKVVSQEEAAKLQAAAAEAPAAVAECQ